MENELEYIDTMLMEAYESLTELPEESYDYLREAQEAYADAWHSQYDYADEYYW